MRPIATEVARVSVCLSPTVLYTDVDGQCDKLWPMTVTSLPHWPSTQHLRRSAVPDYMVGAHQNLNGSRDLTTPFQG